MPGKQSFWKWVCPWHGSIQADITQQVKSLVKSLVGIALLQQVDNVDTPLLHQRLFDGVVDVAGRGAILLGEIPLLQCCIDLHKTAAYPPVERCYKLIHDLLATANLTLDGEL